MEDLKNKKILVLSGEGKIGSFDEYAGRKTESGILNLLRKERCSGDRWVKAYIHYHDNIYYDFENPADCREINDEDI